MNSLVEIKEFLQASYEDDLHHLPEKSAKEVLDLIQKENLEDETNILYKGGNKLIIQVTSHEALRKLSCYTKWCFSRSGSRRDWETYAEGRWVILFYDFKYHSLDVILPVWQVYDIENMLLGGEGDGYSIDGRKLLIPYIGRNKIDELETW